MVNCGAAPATLPPDRHDVAGGRLQDAAEPRVPQAEALSLLVGVVVQVVDRVHPAVVGNHDLANAVGYLRYRAQIRAHGAAQIVKNPVRQRPRYLVDALLALGPAVCGALAERGAEQVRAGVEAG
jgi:hypothetical protein